MRITSITPMKNEAPFILEWFAYHTLIGINDFIVFSNDCTDGTDRMLERLDELGLIRHLTNPSVYLKNTHHHWQATRYANSLARLKRSDWVVSFDVDEFVCVNAGSGTMKDLFEAVGDANVITFNQLNFGSGGLDAYEDKLLIDQYEYCWSFDQAYNGRVVKRGTKSFTHKSAGSHYFANHSPHISEDNIGKVKYVNGSGKPLDPNLLLKDVKALREPDFGYDLVQLNHYAIKSAESFMVQVDRGNANHVDNGADFKYWRRYNNNDLHNTSIQRWSGPVKQAIAELRKDPELNDLHQKAVEIHHAKIAKMKQNQDHKALYDRIRTNHANNPGLTG